MSEAKHTPGPWSAMLKPAPSRVDHGWRAMAMCGSQWMVAAPYAIAFKQWDNEANARLIAAAPELLEALQDIYRELHWASLPPAKRSLATNAAAAIARATGSA